MARLENGMIAFVAGLVIGMVVGVLGTIMVMISKVTDQLKHL